MALTQEHLWAARLAPSSKLVALAWLAHADQHGRLSLTDTARLTGYTRPTCQAAYADLVQQGVLQVVEPGRGTRPHGYASGQVACTQADPASVQVTCTQGPSVQVACTQGDPASGQVACTQGPAADPASVQVTCTQGPSVQEALPLGVQVTCTQGKQAHIRESADQHSDNMGVQPAEGPAEDAPRSATRKPAPHQAEGRQVVSLVAEKLRARGCTVTTSRANVAQAARLVGKYGAEVVLAAYGQIDQVGDHEWPVKGGLGGCLCDRGYDTLATMAARQAARRPAGPRGHGSFDGFRSAGELYEGADQDEYEPIT